MLSPNGGDAHKVVLDGMHVGDSAESPFGWRISFVLDENQRSNLEGVESLLPLRDCLKMLEVLGAPVLLEVFQHLT